jgi:hypothetical protein
MAGVRARAPGWQARWATAGLTALVLALALVGSAPAQVFAAAARTGPGHPASPPAWAGQDTPNPLVPTSSLASVSCPSVGTCAAVGQYFDQAGYWATLAEARNGTSWTVEPTPDPAAGATGVTLSGVSCTAADACTAVGSYVNSADATVTLAERWNGTSWAIEATPNPARSSDSVLLGVSCTAAGACTAAGYYVNSDTDTVTLAESWNGTSWAIQATPNPASSPDNELLGLSCTSSRRCVAVGYFIADQAAGTLAESWDGSSWAIQATPHPSGDIDASLASVACTSAGACTAVGGYDTPAQAGKTLAEAWNGTSWAIRATPNVPGAQNNYLSAVSCTGAGACTAAGDHQATGQPELTLAEAWDGTSWRIQATPSPPGATVSNLSGVSCPAAGACTAVGTDVTPAATSLTLAEAWDGTSWAIQASPAPAGATVAELSAVSCPGVTACTAVGYDTNILGGTAKNKTLAEAWDGASWRIQATPTVADGSVLSAVSCAGTHACMAVGYYLDSLLRPVSLAEAWNGTSWTTVPTPNPPGAADITLSGVSCPAAGACTAVGSYDNSSGVTVTLAESWNGTSWRIQATPDPGATFSQLSGVSCPAAGACTAVGSDTAGTLAEAWNGTSWRVQATPNPSGATRTVLSGVSCTAADACTAVGSYDVSGTATPLAEGETGTPSSHWAIEATPIAQSDLPSGLSGVSCPAAGACTAVGYHDGSAGQVPFADAWNGTTWTTEPTPEPAGSISGILSGVSCPAAAGCTAAGFSVNRSPNYRTLADAQH